MANIQKRPTSDGTVVYRVRIRRKGAPMQTATFTRLTDAKNWAKQMEGAVLDGRHFTTAGSCIATLRIIKATLKPSTMPSSQYMWEGAAPWCHTILFISSSSAHSSGSSSSSISPGPSQG